MTKAIPFQNQNPMPKKGCNILELVNKTEQELEMCDISLDTYRTNLSVMKNERAEGFAEGRAEVAARMIEAGEPIEKIMLYSGLSLEQIESLKRKE